MSHRVRTLIALSLLLGAPLAADGNMANPVKPGAPLGEPAGGLESVVIEHETLVLDLRPLERLEPARVDATYQVYNAGAKRALDLLFVAGSDASDATVTVDGAPLRVTPGDARALPPRWRPPATTPHPWEGEPLPYEVVKPATLRFAAPIDTARHTIRVRYAARPTMRSGDSPTVYWQLAYVLAPARQWAGFKLLDAFVLVPEGWRGASQPHLHRRGDTLSGRWDHVPSDAIALTVQAPPPGAPVKTVVLPIALIAVAIASCVWLGGATGRALARRGRRSAWAVPISLVMASLWGTAAAIATVVLPGTLKEAAGPQAAWTYGYGTMFLAILTGPVAFLVALLVTQVSAVRAASDRRASSVERIASVG